MMTENNNPCYPNRNPIYEETISSSLEPNSTHPTSFLNNLLILKDRVLQVQSLATIFLAPNHGLASTAREIPIPTIGTLIQEIIVTASSMMFACQQMALGPPSPADDNNNNNNNNIAFQQHRANRIAQSEGNNRAYYNNLNQDTLDQWYGDYYTSNNFHSTSNVVNTSHEDFVKELPLKVKINEGSSQDLSLKSYDIIELDAKDLLAKYTHYCQVCGKGFKRDANLRMHMRAHGDEYKSSAALSNPMKNNIKESGENTRKYSCPQEGCRWNKNHAKFHPLKSMICVKNHYKRSHCPKMYVCKRCNTKQFSVLSDLRTHEKHCGDLKWQCSCGTTFSRKDKLMGHVALFVGHKPVITSLTKMGNGAQNADQIVFDDSR